MRAGISKVNTVRLMKQKSLNSSIQCGARKHQRGFTLIEIMVVVVILGILAALVVPNILGNVDEARATAAQQDIRAIESALDMFRLDNFRYPSTEEGIEALVTRPVDPNIKKWKPYLKKLPNDPWGNPYQYLSPGTQGEIDIYSFGADGQPGGEGVNADVGNWSSN
jgi:general secretion pathway protein G